MARAYVRLEKALRAGGLPDGLVHDVNVAFDRATIRFFSGRYDQAVLDVDKAWLRVARARADQAGAPLDVAAARTLSAVSSVTVVSDPPIVRVDVDAEAGASGTLHLRLLHPWTDIDTHEAKAAGAVRLSLVVWAPGGGREGRVLVERAIRVFPDRIEPDAIALPAARDGTTVGLAPVTVTTAGGHTLRVGVVRFADRSLDAVRRQALARLAAIKDHLHQGAANPFSLAWEIASARASLLSDSPSTSRTAEFLLDLPAMARDISSEVAAIENGKDPYTGRLGDWWGVIKARGATYPCRIFAPPAAASGDPLPVVIAFHGAGGDENLFMDGYAAGQLKELAKQRGFLLVSPFTSPLATSPVYLDGLLRSIKAHYAIDNSRIYVMGHSLGAGVTAALSRLATKTLTACVCFAGGGALDVQGALTPTRIYAGELDPIIPAWRTIAGAKRAKDAGQPVTYKLLPNRGHTLLVGDVLNEAVDWLFTHRGKKGR